MNKNKRINMVGTKGGEVYTKVWVAKLRYM